MTADELPYQPGDRDNRQADRARLRELLINKIEMVVEDFISQNYNGDVAERDELVRLLCDAALERYPLIMETNDKPQ